MRERTETGKGSEKEVRERPEGTPGKELFSERGHRIGFSDKDLRSGFDRETRCGFGFFYRSGPKDVEIHRMSSRLAQFHPSGGVFTAGRVLGLPLALSERIQQYGIGLRG